MTTFSFGEDDTPIPGFKPLEPAEETTPDEPEAPVIPKFGTADTPSAPIFEAAKIQVIAQSGVNAALAGDFVDGWAREFFSDKGRFPTFQEMVGSTEFQQAVIFLPLWTAPSTTPPPVFRTPDGQIWSASLVGGFKPLNLGRFGGSANLEGIPLFDPAAALGVLAQQQPTRGGPRGRQPAVFDRAQLVEAADRAWKGLLLEANDEAVEAAVDDYMRKANGFWMSQGGQLDFDTFILERIRATDRHRVLYARKPDELTEAQYIGQFRQVVSQFGGLRPGRQTAELETALKAGVSPAGQAERLRASEVVQRANPEGFAARLAQTVAGLGRGATR